PCSSPRSSSRCRSSSSGGRSTRCGSGSRRPRPGRGAWAPSRGASKRSVEFLLGVLTGAHSLDDLIRWGGYAVLVGIVFTETGLLVGFFLPGDSLLVTAGLVAAAGGLNIWWVNGLLIVVALIPCVAEILRERRRRAA